ncbi:MAG: hypothetical protein NUW01_00055 [Gemmatimonadaceae bacterium]|nr:hypothetical protein [Gemmatimonadaceae bacterium]
MTDPKGIWTIRGVPRSVRLWYHTQAVARGLTIAEYLAVLVKEKETEK